MLVQERELRIRMSDMLCWNREIIKKFWKHVCPVLFNELTAWGVGFTMYSIILGHMGGDAVAANSIANITKNIPDMYIPARTVREDRDLSGMKDLRRQRKGEMFFAGYLS